MKRREILIVLLLGLLPGMIFSQEIVPLVPTDLPEALIVKAEIYDSETFMGYMDSGGDLFLEFGLKQLLFQDLSWAGERIKAEVYEMDSPEAAFGVYSLSVVRCIDRDTAGPYDCLSKYQYQTAHGSFYISVTSESGSPGAMPLLLEVARALKLKNPQEPLLLPEPFEIPRIVEARKNLVFMQGFVGLQNSMFPWQDLLLGVRFRMYAISLPDPDADISFARISFQEPGDKIRFLGAAGLMNMNMPQPNCTTSDGLYHEFQEVDPLTIYFLERQRPYPIDAVLTGRTQ
jgi:hypothetical protein